RASRKPFRQPAPTPGRQAHAAQDLARCRGCGAARSPDYRIDGPFDGRARNAYGWLPSRRGIPSRRRIPPRRIPSPRILPSAPRRLPPPCVLPPPPVLLCPSPLPAPWAGRGQRRLLWRLVLALATHSVGLAASLGVRLRLLLRGSEPGWHAGA